MRRIPVFQEQLVKFINPAPLQTYRLLGIQVPYMVIIERFVLIFFYQLSLC